MVGFTTAGVYAGFTQLRKYKYIKLTCLATKVCSAAVLCSTMLCFVDLLITQLLLCYSYIDLAYCACMLPSQCTVGSITYAHHVVVLRLATRKVDLFFCCLCVPLPRLGPG
jgi:hypothetical protein